MANRTDPLINSVSGSDPQNAIEYITRQRIYDSRYWKEVCFGLSVRDVLEQSIQDLHCLGCLPYTKCIALVLKLLQLNAEYDIVTTTFIEQDEFKYTRALGALYVRLIGRPADIYTALEPLYNDYRKIRIYTDQKSITTKSPFTIWTIDEYVHQLLTSTTIFGITLPRLPVRKVLQEAGYLLPVGGIRPTALNDVLLQHGSNNTNTTTPSPDSRIQYLHDDKARAMYIAIENYLRHKAEIENDPAAIIVWEQRRQSKIQNSHTTVDNDSTSNKRRKINDENRTKEQQQSEPKSNANVDHNRNADHAAVDETIPMQQNPTQQQIRQQQNESGEISHETDRTGEDKTTFNTDVVVTTTTDKNEKKKDTKKKKKTDNKERNYGNLFKKKGTTSNNNNNSRKNQSIRSSSANTTAKPTVNDSKDDGTNNVDEGTVDYWNDERTKLGLKPLK